MYKHMIAHMWFSKAIPEISRSAASFMASYTYTHVQAHDCTNVVFKGHIYIYIYLKYRVQRQASWLP